MSRPFSCSSAPQIQGERRRRERIWAAFAACAVATIALFFIPAFIIRPFRYQSPKALLVALAVRQHAPLFTLIAGLATLFLAAKLWKNSNRWRKGLLVLAVCVVAFSAVMARQNYFEWMFHPIAGAQFIAERDSKLDPKEMIMAVRMGGEARAYPISQMAYHHVLNDVAGGVPIAVTY